MKPLVPRFDLPFRLGADGAAVREQDSVEDIANCVTAILLTPVGWRTRLPGWGAPDYTFKQVPLGEQQIETLVGSQEPRAMLIVAEKRDHLDELITYVDIGVSQINPTNLEG
jgi:phage baseplate assembly protein W